MLRTRENPVRDWFYTAVGSILVAGVTGLISLSALPLLTYILYFFGFLALVFGISGLFKPNKEATHAFLGCVLILLMLFYGRQYGVI